MVSKEQFCGAFYQHVLSNNSGPITSKLLHKTVDNILRWEYLIALSRALYCDPQLLLENGLPEDGEAEAGE